MLYVVSGALVYSLLLGVHYTFSPGLRYKLIALAHFVAAALTLYLILSRVVG
jgi:hypothetical protein